MSTDSNSTTNGTSPATGSRPPVAADNDNRRRRSTLAGRHPARPAESDPAPQVSPASDPAPTSPETPETHGFHEAGTSEEKPSRPTKTRMTVDLPADVLEDAKDAYWAAHQAGELDKWAHYVSAALQAYGRHMQEKLNEGLAFPPRPQRGSGERFSGGRPLS